VRAGLVICGIVLTCVYAFLHLRSRFYFYDDEGFMLMTLKQYLEGRPLYTGMYTEYGPFYYDVLGGLFSSAGWQATHDAMRAVTLACWLLTAGLWGWSVWLWRRSLAMGVAAFVTATVALRVLSDGPGHPQSLIVLLHALAITAVSLIPSIGSRPAFFVVGAATAAVFLTKINIGIFFLAGLGLVFLSGLRLSRSARAAIVLLCAAMPVALMGSHIALPGIALQCLLYSCSLGALAFWFLRQRVAAISWDDAVWIAGGFLVASALTIATALAHGTSWFDLLDGVLLTALRIRASVQNPRPMPMLLSAAVLAGGAGLWWLARRNQWNREALLRWRPLVCAVMVLASVLAPRILVALAPALLWMLTPEPGWHGGRSAFRPQSIAVALGSFALLMVYPVPGKDQLAIAGSLLLVAAFAYVGSEVPVPFLSGWLTRGRAVAAMLLLATSLQAARITWTWWREPAARQHLPNSMLIRLAPEEYHIYSSLVAALNAHCGSLVTVPGVNSLHIWSGLPHPNGFIYSSAMSLFDEPAQQDLLRAFSAAPSPCVVYSASLEQWGEMYRPVRRVQPFVDYVKHGMVTVYSIDRYEIRVPPADAALWR
jgi:hypothetical protein